MHIRGIGPWTANIYLMTELGHPDVWPDGDLALATAERGPCAPGYSGRRSRPTSVQPASARLK